MFNEELKEEFVNTLSEKKQRPYTSIFKKIEPIERKYGKDFYEMNRKQIVESLREFGKETSIRPAFSRLRVYSKWAKDNGYNKGIDYCDKRITTVNELIDYIGETEKKYYISEKTYHKYVNKMKNAPNGLYMVSLMMACYEGIVGRNYENLIHLRARDVVYGTNITLHDGTKRNITPELRIKLLETSALTEIVGRKTRTLKYGLYVDTIWKGVRAGDPRNKFVSMFNGEGRIKDVLNDKKITIESLSRSGFFNYVRREAKEYGYNLKEDMLEEIVQVRRNGEEGRFILSETTEKYDKIFQAYGSNMRFYEFKRLYKDWIEYV